MNNVIQFEKKLGNCSFCNKPLILGKFIEGIINKTICFKCVEKANLLLKESDNVSSN